MSFIDKLKENKKKNEEAGRNDFNAVKNKLLSGGFGLTKTFWLFWLLPTVAMSVMEYVSESKGMIFKLDAVMLILSGFMFLAVLKTTANKLWKGIALTVIGADTLLCLLAVSLFFL
ncbi:hypothetical protein ACF3VQ_16685 [Yersinia sp. HM-2024]|uniref:hypothetical protein n=1 Tax=Yersinia TaxID=629 RepID=UPI0005DBD01E|nr:hypothetical protein [Yersinia frederiksenii]CQI96475.1 Uncharacterised protein [Yersinia frederiksenii]